MAPGSVTSLLSRLLFTWTNKLVCPETCFSDLPGHLRASVWGEKTVRAWTDAQNRHTEYGKTDVTERQTDHHRTTPDTRRATKKMEGSRDETGARGPEPSTSQRLTTKSLVSVILRVFGLHISFIVLAVFAGRVVTLLCKPYLLTVLIASFEESETEQKLVSPHQVCVLLAMFICVFVSSVLEEWSLYLADTTSLRIKSGLSYLVFSKLLRLSTSTRCELTTAKINSIVSADLLDSARGIIWIALRLMSIFNMAANFFVLYVYVGQSALPAILFMASTVWISSLILGHQSVLYQERGKANDYKMSLVTEMLRNMTVIKLQAWEKVFGKKVEDAVGKEMWILTKIFLLRLVGLLAWNITPMIAVALVLVSQMYFDNTGLTFRADTTFAVVILVNELRFSMFDMPVLFTRFYSVREVFNRLQDILSADTVPGLRDDTPTPLIPHGSPVIDIRQAKCTWDASNTNSYTLRINDITIPHGSLVLVTGAVGSGKTSFLSALLGEMSVLEGDIDVCGIRSYAPQEPWLLNASVRDNIVFGSARAQSRYEKVLDSCALTPDIATFTSGDLTEVEEKGGNLSGGQKQRINLARAAYQLSDVILLDDPLSAVDNHVAGQIFRELIDDQGLLGGRTRVMATHSTQWLPFADVIVNISRSGQSQEGVKEYLATVIKHSARDKKEIISDHLGSREYDTAKFKVTDLNAKFSKPLTWESELCVPSVSFDAVMVYLKAVGLLSAPCLAALQMAPILISAWSGVGLTQWSGEIEDIYRSSQTAGTCDSAQHKTPENSCISEETTDILYETNVHHIKLYILQTVCSFACLVLFQILCSFRNAKATGFLASNLLWSCLRAPIQFFQTTPFGQLALRFGHDIHDIGHEVPMSLEGLFYRIVYVLMSLSVVCYACPEVLVFAIPALAVSARAQQRHVDLEARITATRRKYNGFQYSRLQETVEGSHVIRGFGLDQRFLNMLVSAEDEANAVTYTFYAQNRWLGMSVTYVSSVLVLTAALFTSLSQSGSSRAASVGLAVTYALDVGHHLKVLITQTCVFNRSMYCVHRLGSYFHIRPEAAWDGPGRGTGLMSWPKSGRIEFKGYTLKYESSETPALRNISLNILPGQKVGIVGRTGAGKSSLVQALLRLRESSTGSLYIDGVDIRNVGLHTLRTSVSTIPQDPVIFSGTIRWNLDPHGRHSDSDLWSVLGQVQLDECVRSLPLGLGYECREGRGDTFSLGQRQLMCLARALLEKTRIFFLDEATSSLDTETDERVQGIIRENLSDCTLVTIAHRLSNVMDYDMLVVMDAGRIVAMDTPGNLMKNSKFTEIVSGHYSQQ